MNGAEAGSVDITQFLGQDLSNNFDLFVGQHEANYLRWPGIVDDLRVYKRALSIAEVERLYRFGETITAIDNNNHQEIELPDDFELLQNYPNPFNPETTISFRINSRQRVQLSVVNVLGEQIALIIDDILQPGLQQIKWFGTKTNGDQVGSGVYFVLLKAGDFVKVKKMTLLR